MVDLAQSVRGKRVWVTGASSGLGRHFAKVLAAAGAEVAVSARRIDRLQSLVDETRASGNVVLPFPCDVTDPVSIDQAAKGVRMGLGGLDALVNNAGVAGGGPTLATPVNEIDRILDTNLRGALLVAQAAARLMVEGGRGGAIVNIASILGSRVSAGVVPYIASKAGLIRATEALALEWARHGIRVNAIAPGYFATEINEGFLESEAGQATLKRIPQRRIGQPQDLDAVLLLLTGDAAPYRPGATIPVDGGHLCSTL